MTTVVAADCTGLWRRTLMVGADGSRDTSDGVRWLQGPTAYVDSRGFAGTLQQRGDVFEWRRDVSVDPPGPLPDAGAMHWDGDTLVETGVHEDYVEHWQRDTGPTTPCGALFLRGPGGASGLLVRAGGLFGWAGDGVVVIDEVGSPRWIALEPGGEQIQANGVRWTIDESEGTFEP